MSIDLGLAGFVPEQGPAIAGVQVAQSNLKRRVVVILADISHSMNLPTLDVATGRTQPRISALNQQLEQWVPMVREDTGMADIEFAVITFGEGGVRVLMRDPNATEHADGGAFVPASALELGPFVAGGNTPMVAAIERAIALVQRRQRFLKETHSIITGQPRLILFTDGQPTDERGNPTQAWRPLAGRLKALRVNRELQFFGFGVPGVDTAIMRELVPDNKGYFELANTDFKLLLKLITDATTSSDPYATLSQVFE